jgi:TM2 domain-containing membrane protein YozV
MPEQPKKEKTPTPSINSWAPAVALGWLVPGAGHFLLKRPGRGGLIAASVLAMFLFGLMMRGAMFQPRVDDLLTTVIYVGGFVGDLASGLLYLLSVWLGYSQPDTAGHVHDYGTKFLVAAGLLNILAMVDAYEIATGKKD